MTINEQEGTTEQTTPAEAPQQANSEPTATPPIENNNAQPENNETQNSSTEPETKEPETPDWFMKDKYKTIEDQAKSAFELQKKMGKFWGSPQENYKVDGVSGIEENDPLIAALTPALKEMGVSQEGFNHLVGQYIEANRTMMKGMEEELKRTLTTNDAHTYQAIDKWMNETLRPEEAEMIRNNWLINAEDFKLFNELRLMMAPSTNVPSGAQAASKFESSQEVTNENIKYKKEVKAGIRMEDKNFEAEINARFRDARQRELRQNKR